MAGVGKLLKQAQKMQKKMEELQEELATRVLEVSSGGGAVVVKISVQGKIAGLTIDPEFLKEDPDFVTQTLLEAVREAQEKATAEYEEAMQSVTGGMQMPGLF